MERLTEWYEDGISKGVLVKEQYGERSIKTIFEEWDEGYRGMCTLKAYEDTGLTPDQVMELSEAMKKIERYFGDNITVNQVIDFFTDFYVAQGDDERVEAAELLTNEEVERYKRLKERDTAKEPVQFGDEDEPMLRCPHCDENVTDLVECGLIFCPHCGGRWEG